MKRIYIGSTNREYLCQRMAARKYNYKHYKKGSGNKVMSFDIFDKYGLENVKITLIEAVNANSKDELLSREAYYIRNTNCINKYIPLRTDKQYYEDNKDKISEQQKQYYEDNKDKIKQYKEQNKDKIKEYLKHYRENNKKMIKEKKKEYSKQYYLKIKLKKTIEI